MYILVPLHVRKSNILAIAHSHVKHKYHILNFVTQQWQLHHVESKINYWKGHFRYLARCVATYFSVLGSFWIQLVEILFIQQIFQHKIVNLLKFGVKIVKIRRNAPRLSLQLYSRCKTILIFPAILSALSHKGHYFTLWIQRTLCKILPFLLARACARKPCEHPGSPKKGGGACAFPPGSL